MNRSVVTLVNKTDKKFKFMFDGVSYEVPANDELDVTEEVAHHARKKSIMSYDLETGAALYQVGIKGIHDVKFMGKGKDDEDELIDRDTDPDGEKARTVLVRGGKVRPDREGSDLASLLEKTSGDEGDA